VSDEPYRILVTGSRDWADENLIAGALLHETSRVPASRGIVVVHGGARGADTMAHRVAVHYEWQVERHPADWGAPCGKCNPRHRIAGKDGNTYCPLAGHRRNQAMVDLGADVMLAFIKDRSRGATHCADAATRAGIPVRYFRA